MNAFQAIWPPKPKEGRVI